MSTSKKQPLIALVDDDKVFQFTSSRMIQAESLTDRIQQFFNGSEAINHLISNSNNTNELPDIIFLDINMPVSDGWMFLDALKELYPKLNKQINIYMVSSSIAPDDIKRAKSNPLVTDYLVKPLSPETFQEILGI